VTSSVDVQIERAVLAAEDEYVAAEVARDEGALRRLVDDAFRFNRSDGTTSDKQALIQGVLRMKMIGQNVSERSVHLEGQVALVFGTTEILVADAERPALLRYTATYVHRGDRWRLLALQMQPRAAA
jgi:ketosteroid isomerase-like protein